MRRFLLVCAALGVGAVLGSCTGAAPAQAVAEPGARWSVTSDTQGGIWRLNTQTGETDHCRLTAAGEIQCWDVFPGT